MQTRYSVLFGALLSASAIVSAAENPSAPATEKSKADAPQSEAAQAQSAHAEAGLRVYVDPATGQIVSQPVTAEQQRAAAAADAANASFNQSDEGLQIVYFADGSSMMDLQGRFQLATVATAQADGTVRTSCNDADHLKLGEHTHDPDAKPVVVNPIRDVR